jgi:hypothetical protein
MQSMVRAFRCQHKQTRDERKQTPLSTLKQHITDSNKLMYFKYGSNVLTTVVTKTAIFCGMCVRANGYWRFVLSYRRANGNWPFCPTGEPMGTDRSVLWASQWEPTCCLLSLSKISASQLLCLPSAFTQNKDLNQGPPKYNHAVIHEPNIWKCGSLNLAKP